MRWDITSLCARNKREKRYSVTKSVTVLLSVSDYKCLDTSLYSIITNSHTEIKS